MQNQLLSTFQRFPSTIPHLEIRDKNGYLLAYRFKIPQVLVDTLVETNAMLPPTPIHHECKADPRGVFPIRHYATWADSSLNIFYSRDYRHQLPTSKTWIERNQPLWKYLGDQLKVIYPEAYNKLTNIVLPEPLQLLCESWAGVAINQEMTSESILQAHQDWKDCKSAPNAVVPYRNYEEGDLILWQAKYIIELLPGDALLFMGSLICHDNNKVTRGIRNSVNLFTHKSNMDWIRRDPSTRRKRQGGVAVGGSYAWKKNQEGDKEMGDKDTGDKDTREQASNKRACRKL